MAGKKETPDVPQDEMAILESMTPKNEPAPEVQKPSLGVVDTSPKYSRDERLNQLQWIEVNKNIMNYKALFYPENWVFKCRAALGAEIANFSTIDNEDPLSVNDGINELLKTCCRIEKNGIPLSYKNLYEFDRLWFVMFIRDLTMVNQEQKIHYEVSCEYCRESNDVTLSYDNLETREMTDIAKKYYSQEENAFMVQTVSFGVMRFQPSTIFRAELFKEWMLEQAHHRQKPNAMFVKLFWMLVDSTNEREKDVVKKAYEKYIAISNNQKLLSLYLKLNTELQVGLTENLVYRCEHCEKEAHTEIQFPNGISNLLIMSDISSELL